MKQKTLLLGVFTLIATPFYAESRTGLSFRSTENNVWQLEEITADKNPSGTPEIIIDLDDQRQTFKAWGTCFNELGWDALNLLPENEREYIMKNLFSEDGDLKFNIGRFSVGANDYARDWYSLNETDGDFEMKHFNLDRDKTALIPYIRLAQKYNPNMTFWASPWSPPSWMKTNKHYANRSGYNNGLPTDMQVPVYFNDQFIQEPEYLQAYALYFSKMINAFKAEGIPVTTLMYQNEAYSFAVYPSCSWTAKGVSDFHSKYLGPYFAEHHPDVDLVLGTMNTGSLDVYEEILKDPDFKKYVKGIGFQWEGGNQIAEIYRRHPEYELQQTESECGSGTFDWPAAQHTFKLINHYLANGCTKYTFWNAILKDRGMSSWGWYQNALIQVNSATNKATFTPEYYAVKHYTHFITPGSVVLNSTSEKHLVLATKRPDNSIVVVAGNNESSPKTITMDIAGKYFKATLPAKSFTSYVFGNEYAQLSLLLDEARSIDQTSLYISLKDKLNNTILSASQITDGSDATMITASLNDLKNIIKEINVSASVRNELYAVIEKGKAAFDFDYQGKDELNQAIVKAEIVYGATDSDVNAWSKETAALNDAILKYMLSSGASAETPVNLSTLIINPSFDGAGSTGWSVENNAVGGDFRPMVVGERTCWNNWSNNFKSMKISQQINGLAPGIYSVSSYSMCGPGEITNQHTFASTSYDDAESNIKEIDSPWGAPSSWEKLETNKVLVGNDGKLVIGFASTSGGGTKGWFCVTDFEVTYYGNDETAIIEMLEIKKQSAKDMVSGVLFEAAKKRLEAAILKSESVSGFDQSVEMIGELNSIMNEIKGTDEAWNEYAHSTSAEANELVDYKLINDIAISGLLTIMESQEQKLTEDDANAETINFYNEILKLAINYFPLIDEAFNYTNDLRYEEKARTSLLNLINNQIEMICVAEDVYLFSDLTRSLQNEIISVKLTQSPGNDANFDFMIKSAGIGDVLINGVPEGWIVSRTNGDAITKTGRYYDGDVNNRYFDSYNGTVGALYYTATQTVYGLPNGVYDVSCAGRTNGDGVYLIAQNSDKLYMEEFVIGSGNGETGGSIWENAELETPEKEVNSGVGHGWSLIKIQDVEVKDNKLTIGFSNDKYLTGKEFEGNWLSADDFSLIYKSKDISGETSVNEVSVDFKVLVAKGMINVVTDKDYKVYDISGSAILNTSNLNTGIYIIRCLDKSMKVFVP